MKKNKLILAAKILAVVIICLIAFVGIYVQKANKMENVVKDYKLGKDLEGYREFTLKISDAYKVLDSDGKEIGNTDIYDDASISSSKYKKSEEKVNSDDSLTAENYEKSKEIIEKRLKSFGVKDYNISLDKSTGEIYIQVPENSDTDKIVSNITELGTIELKDSEDNSKVYLSTNNLKKARTLYNTTESGTNVILELQFNKDGKNTLKDLSENEYKTLENTNNTTSDSNTTSENTNESSNESSENNTDESSEDTTNTTSEETKNNSKNAEDASNESSEDSSDNSSKKTETQKKVTLYISGNQIISTSFDDVIENGAIDLSMDKASSDKNEISESFKSASTIATILNNGELPLTYKVDENKYVKTDITTNSVKITLTIVGVIIAIGFVYLIIKFKLKGVLALISYICFIALATLLLRYTNVEISLSAIVAGIIIAILNYLFNFKMLKIDVQDKKEYNKTYLQLLMKLLPIYAISIIFCFISWTVLSDFGMVMFWGITLIAIYNRLITKHIVD